MTPSLPVAITMGCPAGIGPEIILKYFTSIPVNDRGKVVVAGDIGVLEFYKKHFSIDCALRSWQPGTPVPERPLTIPVFETSHLETDGICPSTFTQKTAEAMVAAITQSVTAAQKEQLAAICTCPISKESLQLSGHRYPGHTEMLAALCQVGSQVMMMAGTSLKVTLATIHCSVAEVPSLLTIDSLVKLFTITWNSLQCDFGLKHPKIAVAALNPHAGEGGMFGNEEKDIIKPAIERVSALDIPLQGPFPPDTIFFKAAKGEYDAVICMYHDQGLIPFKLLHFDDGVNVTLGLPIVRTSVDHGTAYDIAGKGIASPESLTAAVEMAQLIASNRRNQSSQ